MVCQTPEALKLINTTLHNKCLQVKLFGQRGIMRDTQLLPMPATKMNEEETERQERPRCEVFSVWCFGFISSFLFLLFKLIFLFVLLLIFILFLLFLFKFAFVGGILHGLMPDMKETRKRVELGCAMQNSQRINKRIVLNKIFTIWVPLLSLFTFLITIILLCYYEIHKDNHLKEDINFESLVTSF